MVSDDDFKGDIEFDHVAFRYPTRSNVRVLEDFDVAVKPGEMMALVGASGGGKSTIIKMMERLACGMCHVRVCSECKIKETHMKMNTLSDVTIRSLQQICDGLLIIDKF